MMTCKEFEERVHDFVRMDLLDVKEREAVLEHAAGCAQCAERMSAATELAEASQLVAESALQEQAPPRVEAAILAAFREHHRTVSWRRAFEWVGVGAAAAVLLAFLWTMGTRRVEQPNPAQKKEPTTQSNIPLDAAVAPGGTPTASGESPAEPSPDVESASYAASDFVPVPYAGSITADDPGMIVRVQLTRASLAQLGYPVAEAQGEDLISADILVGEDGWPRGVKLIH